MQVFLSLIHNYHSGAQPKKGSVFPTYGEYNFYTGDHDHSHGLGHAYGHGYSHNYGHGYGHNYGHGYGHGHGKGKKGNNYSYAGWGVGHIGPLLGGHFLGDYGTLGTEEYYGHDEYGYTEYDLLNGHLASGYHGHDGHGYGGHGYGLRGYGEHGYGRHGYDRHGYGGYEYYQHLQNNYLYHADNLHDHHNHLSSHGHIPYGGYGSGHDKFHGYGHHSNYTGYNYAHHPYGISRHDHESSFENPSHDEKLLSTEQYSYGRVNRLSPYDMGGTALADKSPYNHGFGYNGFYGRGFQHGFGQSYDGYDHGIDGELTKHVVGQLI